MLKKVKVYSALSLVLSLSAIAFCIYNYNGTVSEQFRGVNNVAFYGTLGTPVGIAVVALVLGVSAYTAVNVLFKNPPPPCARTSQTLVNMCILV